MAIVPNKPNYNYGVWGTSGNIAVPTSEKVDIGWIIERPPNEFMNWWQNRTDTMLKFINERGLPTWDAQTEYPINAYTVRSGTIYKALTQNVNKDPSSNPSIWSVAYATQTDFSALYNDVQRIKNEDGYLSGYVSKNNPVMLGEAKGVAYKDSTGVSGLVFTSTIPSISVNNVNVIEFKDIEDIEDSTKTAATTEWVQALVKSTINSLVPIGAIIEYISEVVPSDNFMYAHGQAVKRDDYPELFSVIGTRYGIGDGSTTFNLPDKRGLFTREWDNGKGVDSGRVLGTTQEDCLEKHKHIQSLGEAYDALGIFGKSTKKGFQGSEGGIDNDNYLWYTNDGTIYQGEDPNIENPNVIGDETRPKNIAMVSLIRVK